MHLLFSLRPFRLRSGYRFFPYDEARCLGGTTLVPVLSRPLKRRPVRGPLGIVSYNPTRKIMKATLLQNCVLLATFPVLLWSEPAPKITTLHDVPPITGVQELTFGGGGGVDSCTGAGSRAQAATRSAAAIQRLAKLGKSAEW